MIKKLAFAVIFVAALSISALGQKVYTPAKGSAERTAILNALRAPVEKELKQKIVFSAGTFNVKGNWAFLGGELQSPAGGQPNFKKTEYQAAIDADMFDNNFFAVLKKTNGKWKVIDHAIGCTDVCYLEWWKDHKAPKAIFPYSE